MKHYLLFCKLSDINKSFLRKNYLFFLSELFIRDCIKFEIYLNYSLLCSEFEGTNDSFSAPPKKDMLSFSLITSDLSEIQNIPSLKK